MNVRTALPGSAQKSFEAVRRAMESEARSNTAIGVAITLLDLGLYLVAAWLLIVSCSTLTRAVLGIGLGVITALLFTVGHDACHGSFTRSSGLNGILGRIAFLPSYTPFTSWAYAHNSVHHRYTNLRSRDYVWAPYTLDEYEALPAWRRAAERWYRSLTGFGAYYAAEIWWKRLILPRGADTPRKAAGFRKDRLLVTGFGIAEAAAIGALAAHYGSSPVTAVLCAVVLRFVVWNYMMGLVIFQHHTHPEIAWFNDEHKWSYAQAQLTNTVHIVFPRPVNFLLHRIMEHTAHHVDVRIPMYRLQQAQVMAERVEEAGILVQAWSPKMLLWCTRTCKLYDFERNAWLSFNGEVTSTAPGARLAAVAQTEEMLIGG